MSLSCGSSRQPTTTWRRPMQHNFSYMLGAAALAICAAAPAQTYPSKPIRLVVPFTPGGGVDFNARLIAQKLTEYLGQRVIVESRPGSGTNIGNEFVAKSAPDGY